MEENITYKFEHISYEELYNYLVGHTNLHTVPPDVFAKKIIDNGCAVVARDINKTMCGVACTYYNRPNKDFGFLSFIGVKDSMRGLHIGSSLLKETITLGKRLGFENLKLEVRKNNYRAINMYFKYGFKLEREVADSYFLNLVLNGNDH